jgi:hypothetical protein
MRGILRTTEARSPPILDTYLDAKGPAMAAHTEHPTSEPATGAGLLPIFAIAVIVATIAICAVVAAPGTVTLIVVLASVIGFGAGIVALLSRLIGPEDL